MAEKDLHDLPLDLPREEGEQLDEDNRLKPGFVDAVRDAIDADDAGPNAR